MKTIRDISVTKNVNPIPHNMLVRDHTDRKIPFRQYNIRYVPTIIRHMVMQDDGTYKKGTSSSNKYRKIVKDILYRFPGCIKVISIYRKPSRWSIMHGDRYGRPGNVRWIDEKRRSLLSRGQYFNCKYIQDLSKPPTSFHQHYQSND